MKAPIVSMVPTNSGDGERKPINSELWHSCAGPLVSLPPVGSLVVYFPQGHSEQVAAFMQKGTDAHAPNYPNLPSKLICLLHNVTLHADSETDEVYAQMSLQPVNKLDKDALLASDLGLKQNRQPTEFFCKTLTASDTSTHGGFSVPRRAAEKIFPPLDFSMQPPAQELTARDLHDVSWTFRHIYREAGILPAFSFPLIVDDRLGHSALPLSQSQPKRHLLTTGWSVFVSAKRLVAGDSVLFIRDEKSQLLLGIRRANRQQPALSSSVLSGDSMHIGILAAAAHAAANKSPFTVFYNPRASPTEFVVSFAKYHRASYGIQISLGMRFRMMFETEESGVRRYMGTITGISDIDPVRWKNSHWRNLQVGWDESTAGERKNRVSLWEIEPVITPFYLCPPQIFSPKFSAQPGLPDDESDVEHAFRRAMPWLTAGTGAKDAQAPILQGMSLAQWMNIQQNSQLLSSAPQSDSLPPTAQSPIHNLGINDPCRQLASQSQAVPLPSLQFGLPKLQQQAQQQQLETHHHRQNRAQAPCPQTQKQDIVEQQHPQQQQQQQKQQQQQPHHQLSQHPPRLPIQGIVDEPALQAQLPNQVLPQNLIHAKLQQQLLGSNGSNLPLQHNILPNQNTCQPSPLQQGLQLQKPVEEQQQNHMQQQQLPPISNQLQLQLLQKLQQQQQQQQQVISQENTSLLPQQLPQQQIHMSNQIISPMYQQLQQQQQQQQSSLLSQIGNPQLLQFLQNQQQKKTQQQVVPLVGAPSQSLPFSSNHPHAPARLPPARSYSAFTDDDSPSSSNSPSANNCSTSSSFINKAQKCSARVDDAKAVVNSNLVHKLKLKPDAHEKQEFTLTKEVDQTTSLLPLRNNNADHLDETSGTSFCLEGGQQNYPVSPFQPSSLLRNGNQDEDLQVDPRTNLLFGVNIDGPLSTGLEAETLFSNGFNSGRDLHNIISGYNTPRDLETEISTSGLCSQSFGVPDASMKPGCSNSTAFNDPGFLNKGSRTQRLQRVRTFTKVYKRGSVGRSIDVTRYKDYDELRHDLACRFGIQGQLEDPQTSLWKLVYLDHENDILLVGDDPWEEFVSCVQSIKILSATEVQQMSLDGDLGSVPMPNQTSTASQDNVNTRRGYYDDHSGNHSFGSFDH